MEQHDRLVDEAITRHGGVRPANRAKETASSRVRTRPLTLFTRRSTLSSADAANWPTASPLAVRMGIHTGEARLTEAGYAGPAIIRAARIRSLARGGQVLLSDLVRALAIEELDETLLIDAGLHQLDGLQRPEQLWHLAWDGGRPNSPQVRSRGRHTDQPPDLH